MSYDTRGVYFTREQLEEYKKLFPRSFAAATQANAEEDKFFAEEWRLLPVDFESFEYTPPTLPSCDCGGEKTKTPHSDWCSTNNAP